MKDPQFKAGDSVRHKASGKRGIVLVPLFACFEEHMKVAHLYRPYCPSCEFIGEYLVSVDMGKAGEVRVLETVLEAAP